MSLARLPSAHRIYHNKQFADMLRHLFYPFLPYRSLFFPILVASAIAAPCWLIFRLYRVRSSGRRVSFTREILLLIFVVYLAGVAAVSLEPNHPSRSVAESMVGVQLRPSLASLTCSSATMPAGSRAIHSAIVRCATPEP